MSVSFDGARTLELHDDVVQGIATAKLQLESADVDAAIESLDATLRTARAIVTDLLGRDLTPGALRRSTAAQVG